MNRTVRRFSRYLISLLIVFVVGAGQARAFSDPGSYEYNRARLLAYILRQDLETFHFSHMKFDKEFSKKAFGLYMKQLDPQKRIFLKKDVEKLQAYADHIDDEMKSAKIELPDVAAGIFAARAEYVSRIAKQLLSKDFDFTAKESVETDSDKLDYCNTEEELKERWRKTLKLQVLNQYLNLVEEQEGASAGSDAKTGKKPAAPLQEKAREKVLKSYETLFNRTLHETEREHFDRYFGAVARVFDPHTEYMPPVNKEDFDISMKGSLEGIGATLQEEDGYIKVVSIVPGGPAFQQGKLHAEDIILKVAEGEDEPVDLAYMSVRDAVKLIRGKKGTEVRLFVRKPDGTRLVIPIVRDVVQLEDSFVKGAVLKDAKNGREYGYIRIPSFYRDFEKTRHGGEGRNATEDVTKELRKLLPHDISGLIVDLRNNGGGALTDAVRIAGLFIKTGPVVQVKDSDGKLTVLSDDDPEILYSGPLVVLVNKFSASASEILAGALQDYGRAVIVGGEHTHGKGTVQSIIDLNDNIPFNNMEKYRTLGALKVTIQKFYRITGESTQYRGVVPDIVLPDRLNAVKSGEKYLDFALPWDTTTPASFKRWPQLATEIPELRTKSAERIKSIKEFDEIEAASRKAIEYRKKTLQSLNINDLRKERQDLKVLEDKEKMNFHGTAVPDKKTPGMTSEEKRALWEKSVHDDVYVQESESVLDDVISLTPVLTAN